MLWAILGVLLSILAWWVKRYAQRAQKAGEDYKADVDKIAGKKAETHEKVKDEFARGPTVIGIRSLLDEAGGRNSPRETDSSH